MFLADSLCVLVLATELKLRNDMVDKNKIDERLEVGSRLGCLKMKGRRLALVSDTVRELSC